MTSRTHAVVFASGYAETAKPEHVAAQARLAAIAQGAGMRLIGPNTIGLVNYVTGAALTFSPMPDRRPLRPHAIGISDSRARRSRASSPRLVSCVAVVIIAAGHRRPRSCISR